MEQEKFSLDGNLALPIIAGNTDKRYLRQPRKAVNSKIRFKINLKIDAYF